MGIRRFAATRSARARRAFGSNPAARFSVTEALESRTLMTAVVDDFNDGNDAGWTHYSPLEQFGAGGTYEVVDGAYHIFAPTSPAPTQAGPGRAGTFRADANFSDFIASIDIVDWDDSLTDQAFGLLARVSTPGLGSTKGYALTYGTSGDLDISSITDEAPDDLDPGLNVFLERGKSYRMTFEGHGPTLTGKLVDLSDGSIVAATRAVDSTYSSGMIGLVVYDSTNNGDSTADATFDNFFADVAPPDPTVAYWRFDEGGANQEVQPPTEPGGPDSGLVADSYGGDDSLRTYSSDTNPVYSTDLPAPTIPLTGETNRRSMDFNPNEDLYTAQPGALNGHVFNQWTVEASFNLDTVDAYQGIVGKDGKPLAGSPLAPFQLKVRQDNHKLQVEIVDAAGNERQVSSINEIAAGTWYNAAAVSNGTTMSLYLDDMSDPEGYVLQGTVDVAGGINPVDSTWTVGRGMFNNAPSDWTDGRIDEVRISDAALSPAKFLFAQPGPVVETTRVSQVFVNGPGLTGQTSANGVAFRNLAGIDNTFGYPVPAGANQLKSIPWNGGVDRVALRFDALGPSNLEQSDLVVRGSNTASYAISGFTYDEATRTGVWTLSTPIVNDKVRLFLDDALVGGLDGDGDGTAGGDFDFRVNVLRGDANQDGAVNALDLGQLKAKLNRTATNPGSGTTGYSVFADLNADGSINALDLGIAKARLNTRLPAAEPATALLFSNNRV